MKQLRVDVLFLIVICMSNASMGSNSTCKEAERRALLRFKHSFIFDAFNLLGSWVGHDCCSWNGVGCDHLTGHVIKLDLGGILEAEDGYDQDVYLFEAGEVNPALLELKFLTYLDLSFIGFRESVIPDFFGSMKQLRHLNLSSASLCGKLPRSLGNLTEFVSLDLGYACALDYFCQLEGNGLEWAFKLDKLEYLDLSFIDFSDSLDGLNILEKLPSLLVLNLAGCSLENSHDQLKRNSNISSSLLQRLDIQSNHFSGPIPSFIQNLTSLSYLDLSDNNFYSSIPSWFGNKLVDLEYLSFEANNLSGSFPHFIQRSSFLTTLDLSNNQFRFSIPSWLANNTYLEVLSLGGNRFNRVDGGGIINIIGRLCRLRYLDLSSNRIQEDVSESHDNMYRCSTHALEYLNLRKNNLQTLPPSFGELSSLKYLDLSYNNLSVVSPVIGSLSSLSSLDLSHNHIEALPLSLEELSSLKYLNLSYNSLSEQMLRIGNVSPSFSFSQ